MRCTANAEPFLFVTSSLFLFPSSEPSPFARMIIEFTATLSRLSCSKRATTGVDPQIRTTRRPSACSHLPVQLFRSSTSIHIPSRPGLTLLGSVPSYVSLSELDHADDEREQQRRGDFRARSDNASHPFFSAYFVPQSFVQRSTKGPQEIVLRVQASERIWLTCALAKKTDEF